MIHRALMAVWVLLAWCYQADAAVLFFSGFETGTTQEWASFFASDPLVTNVAGDCTGPRSGGWYMRANVHASGNMQVVISPAFNLTTIYGRSGFQIDAAPSALAPFIVVNNIPNTHNLFSFRVGTDRKISWSYDAVSGAAIATGTTVLSTLTWYRFEFKAVVAGSSSGGVEWKLYDATGALVETVTSMSTTTNTQGNIATVHAGGETTTLTGATHFCFDDFILSDSGYLGNGVNIARQGTAGSPTYTAWTTRSGCVNIEDCWSSTPFNCCATSASSAVASAAQTMLVHSFSTTQSGHGTETFAAPALAVLNACKTAVRAVAASGTPGMSIRRRLAGADTDTSKTLSTSALTYDDGIWTDTIAHINAAEIGVVHGSGTINETVTAMALICDYLPSTGVPRHRVYEQ